MFSTTSRLAFFFTVFFFLISTASSPAGTDPLPSWNDGPSKKAITAFVQSVTDQSSPAYVKPAERIAVFDNDGTLWSEQPAYFQLYFAIDRVRIMADEHPDWKAQKSVQEILAKDMSTLTDSDDKQLLALLLDMHSGMATAAYTAIVKEWIQTARHPTLGRPYTSLVFKPMLELLAYLRANGFKTFIVSGSGIEFMRPWVEQIYGIPPEQVVGSSIVTRYAMQNGKPVLVRESTVNFIDDKEGKPIGINQYIGRRPIFAFGNSDGDLQMLQWTTLADGAKGFAGLIHHTDGDREFAYDKNSNVGRLDKALSEAAANGWTVVDMKKEWKTVYPR